MYNDALLQLSKDQALTATARSTNVIEIGNALQNRNIADGEPLALLIVPKVNADITTGDETYSAVLQTDDDVAFGSPTTLATLTLAAAQLQRGKLSALVLPLGTPYERYFSVNFVLGGTTPSVTVDCFVVPYSMIPKYSKYYKSGFTIS